MLERIVFALRRSGIVMFTNPWLLGVAVLYSLLGPLLILGGTGLPMLVWFASGRLSDPGQLWRDPLSFLVSQWQLILIAMAGCFVGFTIYLLVFLFYHGGLTAAFAEALPAGEAGGRKVGAHVFWSRGRELFGESALLATIASLLPLLPALGLLAVAAVAAFRLPELVLHGIKGLWPALAALAVAGFLFLALTLVTVWLGMLLYRLALCARCLENVSGSAAMSRALKFAADKWRLVLLFAVAVLVISLVSWGVTAPFTLAGRLLKQSSLALSILTRLLAIPISFVIGIFLEIWLKGALVALFVDNR